ncbi:PfkB family carbohydrate kinase [Kribbella sp. NPDC055110]
MSDQFTARSPEVAALVSMFVALRKNDGMTPQRLAISRAQPLLHLPAVRDRTERTGEDPTVVAVELVRDQVRSMDITTDRIIADAVLGLGSFADVYQAAGIPASILHKLESGDLGVRRAVVLSYWIDFHQALAGPDFAGAPDAPSDRSLRGRAEEEVFERLAVHVLNAAHLVSSGRTSGLTVTAPSASEAQLKPTGRVIVVGGVTIDHVWRVDRPPDLETSRIATGYSRSPGGKGLSQAVAVARLDFDVALLTAVGKDHEGQEILDHLELEGVDRSLIKAVPNATTPATGIFERPFGESAAAVWRGPLELDSRHLDRHAKALSSSAAVLLTFEIPLPVLHRTLDLVASRPAERPLVIVTPGQPYPDAGLTREALRQIDYLVARPWELERYARSPDARYDPQMISAELLKQGLKALCVLGTRGGTVYLPAGDSIDIPSTSSVIKESSITRDAFCAALATGLIEQRPLAAAVRWAAAAMAAVAEDYLKSPSPPLRARVDAMYQKYFA